MENATLLQDLFNIDALKPDKGEKELFLVSVNRHIKLDREMVNAPHPIQGRSDRNGFTFAASVSFHWDNVKQVGPTYAFGSIFSI